MNHNKQITIIISAILLVSLFLFVSLNEQETKIAIVKPVFSNTAFQDTFYPFFRENKNVSIGEFVITDLNGLNASVIDDWAFSQGIEILLHDRPIEHSNVTIITDIDVHEGHSLDQYDLVILGFAEYISQKEYDAFRNYVTNGGVLLINDACNFLCEVDYSNGYMWLVKGKGWEFNGTHAWKSVYHRWKSENTNWVGSVFAWFEYGYEPWFIEIDGQINETIYKGHEENHIANWTNTIIIATWIPFEPREGTVAIYQHDYCLGSVIHTSVMFSEVMYNSPFLADIFFDLIERGLGDQT